MSLTNTCRGTNRVVGMSRASSIFGDTDCNSSGGAHFVRTELVADTIGRVMSREPTGDMRFEIYKKAGSLSHVRIV